MAAYNLRIIDKAANGTQTVTPCILLNVLRRKILHPNEE